MAGLLDTDLQQDLLAEKDITLDKAVNMAVTRETEKRSQLAMDNKETAAGFLCLYKAGQIFLEAHEKEIIIEKVLPRMRLLFDNVRSLNGRLAIGDKLNIEKRLLENAEESQAKNAKLRCKADDVLNEVDATTSEIDSSIELSDRSQEEMKLADDSEDEDSNYVNKLNDNDSEEENDAVSVRIVSDT